MYKRTFLFLILAIFFIYQNCAPLKGVDSAASNFSSGESVEFSQVKAILENNCVTCHREPTPQNGNVSLDSYQGIMDSEVVLGGNAQNSLLFLTVAEGSMPLGLPPLSLLETETIRTWINSGAPDEEGDLANELPIIKMPDSKTVTLPISNVEFIAQATDLDGAILRSVWSQISGPNTATFAGTQTLSLRVSGVQQGSYTFELLVEDDFGAMVTARVNLRVNATPGPSPTTVSFASDINPILQGKCLSCHGSANPRAGYSVANYAGVVRRVTEQNPDISLLYTSVANDSMPAGGATPLSNAEKTLIRTWIQEGAQNN